MIEYEFNDGGRAAAGFKGKTGDCVVRAIAIVLQQDVNADPDAQVYSRVYRAMAQEMKSHGYTATGNAYDQKPKAGGKKRKRSALNIQQDVMREFGFEKAKLPKGPRPTFSEAFAQYGDCIVSTTKHLAAVVDGALHDIWDGRTYEMLTPYCQTCAPDRPVDGSGGGYDCSVCGQLAEPTAFFKQINERKAMSIWIRV